MKRTLSALMAALLLSGCSMTKFAMPGNKVKVIDPGIHNSAHGHSSQLRNALIADDGTLYMLPQEKPQMAEGEKPSLLNYVADLSYTLVSSAKFIERDTGIGVASFVELESFGQTNLFGLQVTESFIYEMQQYGYSVIEYKTTDFIRVTPEGDFVYSRKLNELKTRLPIQYLLMGTYVKTKEGVVLNARIVGAQSKVVVASAQTLIPLDVYHSTVPAPSSRLDGVLTLGALNEN